MKEKIYFSIAFLILTIITIAGAYHAGRCAAFEDITSEKCWLDKQTRDINCVHYIAK